MAFLIGCIPALMAFGIGLWGRSKLKSLAYRHNKKKEESRKQRDKARIDLLGIDFCEECLALLCREFRPGGTCYDKLHRYVEEGYYPYCHVELNDTKNFIRVDYAWPKPASPAYGKYDLKWSNPGTDIFDLKHMPSFSSSVPRILSITKNERTFLNWLQPRIRGAVIQYNIEVKCERNQLIISDITDLIRWDTEQRANL